MSILVTEWGSYVSGIYSYDFDLNSSSYVTFTTYTTPIVSFLSFENRTFETSTVPLNFTVDQSVSKVTYCLDGQANVTISGNTTLTGLPNGDHNVTVYAMDEAGNIGASQTVTFTIAVPFPTVTVATASTALVAVVCVGIFLYLRRKKKP